MIRLLRIVLFLTSVAAGGWFGQKVPFAEQWPLFEALRTTAAIIFAVIGAWLAIIYPDRIKLSLRGGTAPQESKDQGTDRGLSKLFTPVVNATTILSVILVVGICAPILKRVALPLDVAILRGLSYALLVALTNWQLWTVILTLVPASEVKDHADAENSRRDINAGLTKLNS